MISPSQRPLPDNTQHSQQTNIHPPGGIRTHDPSRRAAVDLRLRTRGYWDRQFMASRLQKCLSTSCIWVRRFHQTPKEVHGRKRVKNPWRDVYIKLINERITVSLPFLKARPWPDTQSSFVICNLN
jgi:hypothetical protein